MKASKLKPQRMTDGSVRMKAIGGPAHGAVFRWYPPFDVDDRVEFETGGGRIEVYVPREGEGELWSSWNWVHSQEESDERSRGQRTGTEVSSQ